jgi:DNA-binding FadR family transcriptional regulator
MLVFAPVPDRPTAAESCSAVIRRAIVRGEIAAGSRLPPERELAQSLGVNRTTLRAALRELAHGGLLHVRQGSGYAVRDFLASGGPDLVPALVDLARESGDLGGTIADLLLVRRQLARAVLERLAAAAPLPDRHLAAIEAAIADLEAAATRSPRAPARALAQRDIAVVRAIVAATRSAVLSVFVNPVEAILESVPELSEAMYADPATNVAAYRALVASLPHGRAAIDLALAAIEERDQVTLERLARRAGRRPKRSPTPRTPT